VPEALPGISQPQGGGDSRHLLIRPGGTTEKARPAANRHRPFRTTSAWTWTSSLCAAGWFPVSLCDWKHQPAAG